MYFDSHAHYNDERFDEQRDTLLTDIKESEAYRIVNVGSDIPSSAASLALADKYDFIYAAAGVHPNNTDSMSDAKISELEKFLEHPRAVALGEIGLDYHYPEPDSNTQKKWFIRQMELARKLNMPVIIHNRESHADCMDIIRAFPDVTGVVHCYSGSAEMAKELLKLGYYISFTGVITFKNARKSHEVISMMPLDRIMIETDCPYLAPEPYRGKLNHSGYVFRVAETIAQLRNIPVEDIARITYDNALEFYRLK